MPAALIKEYIHRFWGYGRWENPVWFLGMEEGMLQGNGENGPVKFEHRLNVWLNRGCRELEDAPSFCGQLGIPGFFPPPPAPPPAPAAQPTWDRLTKIYLAARLDRAATTAEIHNYRVLDFGRIDQVHAERPKPFTLIELFPLPSRDTVAWPYAHLAAELPFLINRDAYRHSVFADRAITLLRKVEIHRPLAVLCYSKLYRELFEGVFRVPFPAPNAAEIPRISVGTTQIFLTDHVVAFRMTNAKLTSIGQTIRQELTPVQRAAL